jgi:thioredoxin-like negative regulator of GroEL
MIFFYRGSDDYTYKLRRRLRAVSKRYPLASGYAIDIDKYPAASGEFGIFQMPTVRIYIDGSMAMQKAGGFDIDEVEEILSHYTGRMTGKG